MRFTTTTIVLALVAFTSSQALAAALPAHGESINALRSSGHGNARESLETRDIEILEERGRARVGGGEKKRESGEILPYGLEARSTLQSRRM